MSKSHYLKKPRAQLPFSLAPSHLARFMWPRASALVLNPPGFLALGRINGHVTLSPTLHALELHLAPSHGPWLCPLVSGIAQPIGDNHHISALRFRPTVTTPGHMVYCRDRGLCQNTTRTVWNKVILQHHVVSVFHWA
jgi:hypothetical protein